MFKACTLWEELGYRWQVARRNYCTYSSNMHVIIGRAVIGWRDVQQRAQSSDGSRA